MAKKEQEPKTILEREYIIPLRREWLKVPEYKRANKAVKALKQFIVRHMKVYDRDLKKVKIDILLNNELRFRGMRKPPIKIKVKAEKKDNGLVFVRLSEIPKVIQYKIDREARKKKEQEKKESTVKTEEQRRKEEAKKAIEADKAKKEEETEEKEGGTEEKKKDAQEKEKSTVEAGLMAQKRAAKQMKHVSSTKKRPTIHRMALKK